MHTQLRRPVRLTPQQIYKFKQQAPAVPERIAALLNIARANLVFIPRVTADNKPCDPLLDKYLQLKTELAAAIDADDKGTPCRQLDAAIFSFQSGESETLVEGWVRMWLKNESERVAAEMLQAAHAQQEQFVSPIPDTERINQLADADIQTIEMFGMLADAALASKTEMAH